MTDREKYAEILDGDEDTWLAYMADRSETVRVYAAIAYSRGASCDDQMNYIRQGNAAINEVIAEHTKYTDVRLCALRHEPSDRTISAVLRHKEKECINYIIENAELFKDHVYHAVEAGGNEYVDKILDGNNSDLYYIAAVLGNEKQIKEFISRAPPSDIHLVFAEMNLESLYEERQNRSTENQTVYREKLKHIFSSINDCTSQILDKEEYEKFLNCVHNNPHMSINNQLLVYKNRPECKDFHTYEDWKQEGIAVKRGEKGISIIQSNGKGYGIKKVFDISQTDKKPTVDVIPPLGSVIASIEKATSYKVRDVEMDNLSRISFFEKTIYIKKGLSDERKAKGIFRELARSSYHGSYNLYTITTEFLLCKTFGLDTRHIKMTDRLFSDLAAEKYLPFAYKERLSNIKNSIAKSIRTTNIYITAIQSSMRYEEKIMPKHTKRNTQIESRFIAAKSTADKRNQQVKDAKINFIDSAKRGDNNARGL